MVLEQTQKLGLILVSHGSPSPAWNEKMEMVCAGVKKSLAQRSFNPFIEVRLGHLEFATPRIADVCDELELTGCDRIIAYPLFISVSGHSERDIPNALNIRFHDYIDPKIRRYTGRLPVTMASPMDHGPLLPQMVAACAQELAVDPDNECVLVLSHGGGCEHFWSHIHARVEAAVRKATGITTVGSVYVQTCRSAASQDRLVESVDKILSEDASKKVLILSCFGGLSGAELLDRVNKGLIARGKSPLGEHVVGCSGWTTRNAVFEEITNVVQRLCVAVLGGEDEEIEKQVAGPAGTEEFPVYD